MDKVVELMYRSIVQAFQGERLNGKDAKKALFTNLELIY